MLIMINPDCATYGLSYPCPNIINKYETITARLQFSLGWAGKDIFHTLR